MRCVDKGKVVPRKVCGKIHRQVIFYPDAEQECRNDAPPDQRHKPNQQHDASEPRVAKRRLHQMDQDEQGHRRLDEHAIVDREWAARSARSARSAPSSNRT